MPHAALPSAKRAGVIGAAISRAHRQTDRRWRSAVVRDLGVDLAEVKAVERLMEEAAAGCSTRDIAAKLGTHAMRVSRALRAIEAATGTPLRKTAAKRLTVDQIERQLRTTRAGAHPAAWGEAIGRLHRW